MGNRVSRCFESQDAKKDLAPVVAPQLEAPARDAGSATKLAGQKIDAGAADSLPTAMDLPSETVKCHPGFASQQYRFVFTYGDTSPCQGDSLKLQTVRPDGNVCEHQLVRRSRGVIFCHVFPQSISSESAAALEGNGFVWKRDDGTYAVVEAWEEEVDENVLVEDCQARLNPDPKKFQFQAVIEFRQALNSLFGEAEVERVGIRYYRKRAEVQKPVLMARSEVLLRYLAADFEAQGAMSIDKVFPEESHFLASVVDRNGKVSQRAVTLEPNTTHVVYTLLGDETMTVAKPLAEFEREAELLPECKDGLQALKRSSQKPTNNRGSVRRSVFVVTRREPIEQDYEVNKDQLGEGAYGQVFRVKHRKTGLTRALKKIAMDADAQHELQGMLTGNPEVDILRQLDHPHVSKLHELFQDKQYLYLVMEFCAGGELFDAITAEDFVSSERACAHVMRQILASVHYMHSQHFCHRDLKPENFLLAQPARLEEAHIKLIDFGLSTPFKPGEILSEGVGTPYYVSPQVVAQKYTHLCDLWSAGTILFLMLAGYPPFNGDTDDEIVQLVEIGKYSFDEPEWEPISQNAKDLVKVLLEMDESKRLSGKQALDHPWLAKAGRATSSTSTTVVRNLRRFRAQGQLKMTALQVIASQLTEEQIETKLREIFVALDTNGDGRISARELREGLQAGATDLPSNLEELLREVGASEEGNEQFSINYTEFLAATLDRKVLLQEDVCRAAFNVFDLNGDGVITKAELQGVLSSGQMGQMFGGDEMMQLMKEADLDGNGQIDFQEFMAMMQQHKQKLTRLNTGGRFNTGGTKTFGRAPTGTVNIVGSTGASTGITSYR